MEPLFLHALLRQRQALLSSPHLLPKMTRTVRKRVLEIGGVGASPYQQRRRDWATLLHVACLQRLGVRRRDEGGDGLVDARVHA